MLSISPIFQKSTKMLFFLFKAQNRRAFILNLFFRRALDYDYQFYASGNKKMSKKQVSVNPICAGISGGGPQQHSNRRGDQESGGQRWGAHGNQSQQSQVHLALQVGGSLQVRKHGRRSFEDTNP